MPTQQLVHDPVLVILFLASLVSWAIILDRVFALRRERIRGALGLGLADKATDSPDCSSEMQLARMDTTIALCRQTLERGLPLLGAIGSTAPYLGLLGTVIGIIQAFSAIQAQNNMSPSVVAGGIAAALVATAFGLGVAIPAVAAHHLISDSIDRQVSAWESDIAAKLTRTQGVVLEK